jgi:hypothetical protein
VYRYSAAAGAEGSLTRTAIEEPMVEATIICSSEHTVGLCALNQVDT